MKNKSKIKFSTKSKNLLNLKKIIKSAKILDQISFTIQDYLNDYGNIEKLIKKKGWSNIPLIIRSSCINEDGVNKSGAGQFLSVSNVIGFKQIKISVDKVIKSYSDDNKLNEVLIQPFLKKVKISGVVFTRDINNNSPYIKINYDDTSGRTDTITSGCISENKVFYYHKNHEKIIKGFKGDLIKLCRELENVYKHDALDIEFAVDKKNILYLLQVRPLIINHKKVIDDDEHYNIVKNISNRIRPWLKQQPNIHGKNGMYGLMPDWNPAEIIGCKPKPLSLSLYRELITNSIWAYQRNNYGYKNLRSFPLLIEIEGIPYIDVRASFNSFIPKELDNNTSEKLVNYYLDKLKRNPSYHDKVEFDIIFSCFTFDTKENLKELKNFGFTKKEIEKINNSLLNLTNNILNKNSKLWIEDLKKIDILEKKFISITQSNLDKYAKIYWLIEDCKRYGTLPFAGLARAAFISIEMLKSFVNQNIISTYDYNSFLSNVNTVSGSLVEDFNILTKKEFLKKYGHLRPGTYDIMSKSYKEGFSEYFKKGDRKKIYQNKKFKFTKIQINNINKFLKKYNINTSANTLIKFIKESIEAREYAKFMFTKNINEILNVYCDICKEKGIPKIDASFTHIGSVISLNSVIADSRKILQASIDRRKKRYEYTKLVNLPNLIFNHENIFYFYEPDSAPNYITQKSVTADIVEIKSNKTSKNIDKKIVFIENADPGYDWILSHDIAGMVTKYGGANSHMAIRASELNIPAVIGAGPLYDRVVNSNKIEINTIDKKISIIN